MSSIRAIKDKEVSTVTYSLNRASRGITESITFPVNEPRGRSDTTVKESSYGKS